MASSSWTGFTSSCWRGSLVLDESDVEKIASSQKIEGRKYLAKCFGWAADNLEDDRCLGDTIHLDYLYDVIMFCSKKGFPWNQIKNTCCLAKQFMESIAGVSLIEAVNIYYQLAVSCSGEIDVNILQSFTSYIFSTVMHHYCLYQVVLTRGRDEFLVKIHGVVEPPGGILPLRVAKPQHIYDYEQRLRAIEQEETARKEDIAKQKESLIIHQTSDLMKKNEPMADPVSRELLEEVIQEAARSQCDTVQKLLQIKAEDHHGGLNFYLEKTSLPRPAELGAPPRMRQSAVSRTSTKSKVSARRSKNSKKATKK